MSDSEGIIRYRLAFTPGPPVAVDGLDELIAWRRLLRRLGLLGQDPNRYAGLGFGNVSLSLPGEGQGGDHAPFVITGSQTGHLADLGPEHFAVVEGWDIAGNRLDARGPIEPSSEALTHAAVYEASRQAGCVMHVHAPEIWRRASVLSLPTTSRAATYGTPRLADEVREVVRSSPSRQLLVMRGHEDGVVVWGGGIEAAGLTLVATLAQAFRLEE